MNIKKLLLLLAAAGICGTSQAQLPKLNKGTITKKAESKVKSTANNTVGDAAQHTERLNNHNSKLKGLAGSANWADKEFVDDFQYALGYFSTDLARANDDPGGKPAFKKFEPNFAEFLAMYQDNYDLADQRIYPVIKDDEAKKAQQEAFRKVVYPYSQLKKREAKEKSNWGDAEWVNEYAKFLGDMETASAAYKSADPLNQGRVERYAEARKPLQALYDERKEFPARRKEYSEYLVSKEKNAKAMKAIAEAGYDKDQEFVEAAREYDWAKNRAQVAFLNEWDFSVLSSNIGGNWLKKFTTDWASENKAALDKATADAKAAASSEKYAYVRYMQAIRYSNLSEAATLFFPEDKAAAAKLTEAKSLVDAKKKEYEAETFTSAYHKENTYTIGFSSTGAKGFSPKKSFTAGEKFVFTVFFDRPIALIYPEGELVFHIDGVWDEEETVFLKLRQEDMDKSYFDYTIFGDNPYLDPEEEYMQEELLRELVRSQGKSGEVSLAISSRSNVDKRVTPAGKFTFDGSNAAGIAKYDAKRIAMTDVRLADVRMPKAGMQDAALAAAMKKAFMDHYKDSDVVEVSRVVITSSDWTVSRNEWTGIILSRSISASVAYKRIDGTCRFEDAGFAQDSQGGGKYGPTYWNGVGTNDEISCKNVNK